jgi:hypothetical protein
LHAAIFQLSQKLQLELGSLSLRNPEGQQLLVARQINAQRQVTALTATASLDLTWMQSR